MELNLYDLYTESVLVKKERDKLDDKKFGIPKLRKYPLIDAEHTKKAIQLFKYCDEKDRETLAENIYQASLMYGVNVTDKSPIFKYLKKEQRRNIKTNMKTIAESNIPFLFEEFHNIPMTEENIMNYSENCPRLLTCISQENGGNGTILIKENQVIGFININENNFIRDIYVIETYRNQGIGSTLLESYSDKKVKLNNKDKIKDFFEKNNFTIYNESLTNLFMLNEAKNMTLKAVSRAVKNSKSSSSIHEREKKISFSLKKKIHVDAITHNDPKITGDLMGLAKRQYNWVNYCKTLDDTDYVKHRFKLSINHFKQLEGKARQNKLAYKNFDLNDIVEYLNYMNKKSMPALEEKIKKLSGSSLKEDVEINLENFNLLTEETLMNNLPNHIYHLSYDKHEDEVFKPRHFDSDNINNKMERDVARICFSDSINGALQSICDTGTYNFDMYVHIPANVEEGKDIKFYSTTTKDIYDTEITHEIWSKEPTKIVCIGKIHVYGINPDKYKDIEISDKAKVNYKKLRFFEYKWKWIEQYFPDKSLYEGQDNLIKKNLTDCLSESLTNYKPLYFYHLIDKNANIKNNGIISLEYMWQNNMIDLFKKSTDKYRYRLCNGWNIYPNRKPESLTLEEIYKGLILFRGKYGTQYIYLFKYHPYKNLDKDIKDILKYKKIYRIDLNNSKIQKIITDIYYNYNNSNSDDKKLDRNYYENISIDDYFNNFNPSNPLKFASLNHIGLATKEFRIPYEFLEEVKIPNTIEDVYKIENNNYLNESYVINEKDIYYNKEKFDKGEINLCFITGHSGSGKSTMGRNMASKKVDWYDLDDVMSNWNFTDKNLKEYGDLIYTFFKTVGSKYRYQSYEEWKEKLKGKDDSYYEIPLINDFINYSIRYAKSHNNMKYVIEGVWLFHYSRPEILKDYAVYIKGTSMLVSKFRGAKRDSADAENKFKQVGVFSKNFLLKRWKVFFNDEKKIEKWRNYYKNLCESTSIINESFSIKEISEQLNETFETRFAEPFLPKELTLYHGSSKKFDKIIPNAKNTGTRFSSFRMSSFWMKVQQSAILFAILQILEDNKCDDEYYFIDIPNEKIVFHKGMKNYFDKLFKNKKIFIYEKTIPTKYISRGHFSGIHEYTLDIPVKPDNIYELNYSEFKNYIDYTDKILSREEIIKMTTKNATFGEKIIYYKLGTDYNKKRRYMNLLMNNRSGTFLSNSINDFYKYLCDNTNYGLVINNRAYKDNGNLSDKLWDKYKTISPQDFEKYKTGTCWDYVAYEDYYFKTNFPEVKYKLYYCEFLFHNKEENNWNQCQTHTWLVYSLNNKYYIFEVAWDSHKGIKEFNSESDMINYYIKELQKANKKEYKYDKELYKLLEFKQWNDYGLDFDSYMNRFNYGSNYDIKLIKDNGLFNSEDQSKADENHLTKNPDFKFKIIDLKEGGCYKYLKKYMPKNKFWKEEIKSEKDFQEKFVNSKENPTKGEIIINETKNELIGYEFVNNKGLLILEIPNEKYRGYGIGKLLLDNSIIKHGCWRLYVAKDNEIAIKLYKERGFVIVTNSEFNKYSTYYYMELKRK